MIPSKEVKDFVCEICSAALPVERGGICYVCGRIACLDHLLIDWKSDRPVVCTECRRDNTVYEGPEE